MNDRTEQATRIAENAERMLRLIELNAPELVIEQSRRSLFKRLYVFPINEEGSTSANNVDEELYKAEQKFLFDNGYYKDIEQI